MSHAIKLVAKAQGKFFAVLWYTWTGRQLKVRASGSADPSHDPLS